MQKDYLNTFGTKTNIMSWAIKGSGFWCRFRIHNWYYDSSGREICEPNYIKEKCLDCGKTRIVKVKPWFFGG